jgi:serralysin
MPVQSTTPSALLPVGDEFVLNTLTAGDQFDPVVTALAGGGYVVLWSSGSANQTGPIALRAQRLDADGNKVGAEILVDDATNNVRDYRIEALAGGGFAIVWQDNRPGDGGGGSGSTEAMGVRAQLYSAAGVPLGGPIQVNTTIASHQQLVEIAELADGKFVVTWTNAGDDVYARILAADGTPFSGEFRVNTSDTFEQTLGKITALQNGGFVIAWEDHSMVGAAGQFGGTAQIDVRAQYFDASGAAVGGEILVNSTTAQKQADHRLITLDNGNVLVAWNDYSTGTFGGDVRGQIIDAAGNKVGGEFQLDTTTSGRQFNLVLQSLSNGGFVASWLNDSGVVAPRLQVFAADGGRVGPETEVRPGDTVVRGVQSIVRLADGGFAIAFDYSPSNDISNLDSFVQVFNAGGLPVGGPLQLHADSSGNQSLGSIGALAIGADGRMLAVWMQRSGLSTDSAGLDLRARLFDSPVFQTGSDSPESLTGTAGIDVIDGRGGDDSISGLAGNDYLAGGAGADRLDGGTGNDTYYVDDPADVVLEAAGEGDDRIATAASYELAPGVAVETLEALNLSDTAPLVLAGNELANRVVGNAGANILYGGDGDDRLEGGAGNDYLVGGLGADRMFGNAGNDTFYVDNAGDTIFEAGGDGVDRVAAIVSYRLTPRADVQLLEAITLGDTTPLELVGNEIGQLVVGNAGDNLIDGGGGRDELIGLGGADRFRFADALGIGNVDHIQDFQSGTDRFVLDRAVFSALAPGALPAGAFVVGTAALDADDRIVYDQAAGRLLYDSDGSGAAAAVAFATVLPGQTLAASDFVVI